MQGSHGGGKVPDTREERKVPGRRVPGKGKEGNTGGGSMERYQVGEGRKDTWQG